MCLGTGIGGAAFFDGKLVEPKRCAGFEVGHMIIVKDGKECKCGSKGCYERYASMRHFKRDIREKLNLDEFIDGGELRDVIRANITNEKVQKSIDEFEKEKGANSIKIFIHEWEGKQKYFVDFPQVIAEINSQLLDNGIENVKLLYVCGMDHYIKCKSDLYHNVVVIDRKPYKSHGNKNKDDKKNIYFINDESSEPFSSTSIKEFYKNGDYESIKKITFNSIYQDIIKIFDEYYKKGKHT
jgi:hypothetical protein